MNYRELAERAVLALHLYRHAGMSNANFPECRVNLCGDWHALEALNLWKREQIKAGASVADVLLSDDEQAPRVSKSISTFLGLAKSSKPSP